MGLGVVQRSRENPREHTGATQTTPQMTVRGGSWPRENWSLSLRGWWHLEENCIVIVTQVPDCPHVWFGPGKQILTLIFYFYSTLPKPD